MALENVLQSEQALLRDELRQLKRCQLQYFLLSVGGSGFLLGIYKAFPAGGAARELTLMAPLVILLPCWWTFFDKATTITRLVGYIRVCEQHLAQVTRGYIGYETALAYFRETEDAEPTESTGCSGGTEDSTGRGGRQVIRHGYWIVNWLSFFALSLLSAVMPLFAGVKPNPWDDGRALFVYLGLAFVAITGSLTGFTMHRLRVGRFSYEHATEFWKTQVLQPRGLLFTKDVPDV